MHFWAHLRHLAPQNPITKVIPINPLTTNSHWIPLHLNVGIHAYVFTLPTHTHTLINATITTTTTTFLQAEQHLVRRRGTSLLFIAILFPLKRLTNGNDDDSYWRAPSRTLLRYFSLFVATQRVRVVLWICVLCVSTLLYCCCRCVIK